MKVLGNSAVCFFFFSILFTACDQSRSVPLNPNGDSELAVLMREMYEDGVKMKKQIRFGGVPTPSIDHSKMLVAEATEPEKVASQEYVGFSDSYLEIMATMKNMNRENASEVYTQMVDQCKSCHQALCPGPIVKIEKLYLDHSITD